MSTLFRGIFTIIVCIIPQLLSCRHKENENFYPSLSDNFKGTLEIEQKIDLPGVSGRFDHMAADIKEQLLFVAALGNRSVEVVDFGKGKRTKSINDIEEPQGIVYIDSSNAFCVSSGGSGNCSFYDTKTFSLIKTVYAGPDADNMRFDQAAGLISTGYGDGGLALIDAVKQDLKLKITFDGHPEAFQLDKSSGRIFVNVPDTRSIVVVDSKSNSVTGTWKINNASSNFPMALDEPDHCLFIGCREPALMLVFDIESSQEIARFDIKEDVDDIFYDPVLRNIYFSCGEGFIQVFTQKNKSTYSLFQQLSTSKRARTSLYVPEIKKFFLAVPQNGSEASIWVYKVVD